MIRLIPIVKENPLNTFKESVMNIFKLEKDNFNGSREDRLEYGETRSRKILWLSNSPGKIKVSGSKAVALMMK